LHTALVAWRTQELTSERHRRQLARSVERTVRDLSPQLMPSAVPLNRAAVRPHADLLVQIATRLRALGRPVAPRGVLLVQDLLGSADSPLYLPEAAPHLRRSMLTCLDALDGTPHDVGVEERRFMAVAS
jgi:hypothetical protein